MHVVKSNAPAVHNRGKCYERGFFVRAEVSLQHCTVMLLEDIRCSEVSACDVYLYLSVYMSQFIGHISVHLSLRNVLSVKCLQTVFCVGNRID